MQDTHFTGQPIFCQLLSLIPKGLIDKVAQAHRANHYYKRFKARDHLITMLFTAFTGCKSLREVTTGMQVWHRRLHHLGLNYVPRRSTLSDANAKRSADFFQDLFHRLYRHYYPGLPDSRKKKDLLERLFLVDSTTISLFQEIMKNAGRTGPNGKRKGGAKAHVLLNAREDVPQLVVITPANRSDQTFLPHIHLPKGSVLVFDRGYNNFRQWQKWTDDGLFWVTRSRNKLSFEVLRERKRSEAEIRAGIVADQKVLIGTGTNRSTPQIMARRIVYKDPHSNAEFVFLTNHNRFKASNIAAIYKQRWQIELLFRRIKQNYPLRDFLGDNENAIRIQIWSSLICDLLIKRVQEKVSKRKWSYSNLASIIRLHLGTYIDLRAFLDHPEKALLNARGQYQPERWTLFEGA